MVKPAVITNTRRRAFRALKIELLRRGWNYATLSLKTGVTTGHVRAVASGTRASRFVRRKIESVTQVALWSTKQEHAFNQRITSLLGGVDPIVASREEVDRAILAQNLNLPLGTPRAVWLLNLRKLLSGKIRPASRSGVIWSEKEIHETHYERSADMSRMGSGRVAQSPSQRAEVSSR